MLPNSARCVAGRRRSSDLPDLASLAYARVRRPLRVSTRPVTARGLTGQWFAAPLQRRYTSSSANAAAAAATTSACGVQSRVRREHRADLS
jgi:hypothetical protein